MAPRGRLKTNFWPYGSGFDIQTAANDQIKSDSRCSDLAYDPYLWLFETLHAMASISREDFQQAADYTQRAIQHPSVGYWAYATLACALGHLDRTKEAHYALEKLRQVKSDFSMQYLEDYMHFANVARLDLFFDGLRKAGLDIPDEPPAAN